jgi:hypothetical protein
MWIAISVLAFLIVVTIGAFSLMIEDNEDITETRRPPFYNPYESPWL